MDFVFFFFFYKTGDFGESKMLGASLTAKDENLTMKEHHFLWHRRYY